LIVLQTSSFLIIYNMSDKRKKCSYPMSEFYIYEDEVEPYTRVSTPEECEECDDEDCDSRFCLITEYPPELGAKIAKELKEKLNERKRTTNNS